MDLFVTIDTENTVWVEGFEEDELVFLQRLQPVTVEVRDMRPSKPEKKRFWKKGS